MNDRFNPPLPANEEAVAAKARQPKRLPILCLDFDGVLHGYQSGWQGAAIIPDPPVPGAVQFLHGAVERFQVAIYSSRSGQPGGIDAMRGWLKMWLMAIIEDRREAEHVFDLIQWPTEKPAATVSIDDRAIQFTGLWPSLDEIAAFQPWNKRTLSAPSEAETVGGDGLSQAALDVLAERRRQVNVEGWTPEHDDQHNERELGLAAACYASAVSPTHLNPKWSLPRAVRLWPWDEAWWKPSSYRRNLVKAGALILAEIERLDRAAEPTPANAGAEGGQHAE